MESYLDKRKHFYNRISDFWPDMYGEEYALYDILPISHQEVTAIRLATERIGSIFYKTAELLRNTEEELLAEMGFPCEALDFLRLKALATESVIARLDLIEADGTYKCIEINSDTPTFIKELFYVNGKAAQEFGYDDPNSGMAQQLAHAVRRNISESAKWLGISEPYIIFTAHSDNIEDKNTALYLQELYGLPAKFVPLHELNIIPEDGLFDQQGRRIDILYRQTFPIENLLEDEDASGNKIGLWLLELVKLKKLALINPPSAFLLQNKAVQAVIWGLHEAGSPFFTHDEHSWIKEYFLPTFFEPEHFIRTGKAFVKKPIYGREGDTVQVFDPAGNIAFQDKHQTYTHFPSIFQKFADLPEVDFESGKGRQSGRKLIGSFLVDGRPSAIGVRVGERITNNLSCFLPIGIPSD